MFSVVTYEEVFIKPMKKPTLITGLLSLFLLTNCTSMNTSQGEYGQPITIKEGQTIEFPNFTIEYLGERHEMFPEYPAGFLYDDFEINSGGEKKVASWTAGTGDIGPVYFEFQGQSYVIEKVYSQILPLLNEGEILIWTQEMHDEEMDKKISGSNQKPESSDAPTDEQYVIFPAYRDMFYHILIGKTKYTPSLQEVEKGLKLLKAFLKESEYMLSFEDYKTQWIGYKDEAGKKFLWVNAFCSDYFEDVWKETLVEADDGGNCFFNASLNLEMEEVFDFRVNGEA